MPPLPAAPQVVRVALSGAISLGGVWLTRHYLRYSGAAPTNAQLATFNASIATAINTDLVGLIDTDTTITQIESVDLTSASSAIAITVEAIDGARSGGQLPAQTAFVTSYEIGRRYRGGHARGYWKFGTITDLVNPRQWTAALLSQVASDLPAYFTAIEGAGWTGAGTLTQVNVSYYSGFHVVTNPITGRARNVPLLRVAPTIDTVTSITPRSSIGTQRRREAFIA